MKKFLLTLLIIFLLVFGGFGYMFYRSIDEKNYKTQIIASVKDLTGCDMVVDGQIKVQLLPTPVIRLTDVKIKNKKGFSDEYLMKIQSVEARIQFASLLKNPLVVDNITLNNPQISFQKNKSGEINWDFAFLKPANKAISKDEMLGKTFSDLPPQFQNIELKNAIITYKNELNGANYQLADINGKVVSSSINGPFDFSGTLKSGNILLSVTAHLDKLNMTSETKFDLSALNPNSKAVLSVQNGKLEKFGSVGQTSSGSFTFNIPKLSSFLLEKYAYKKLPEELNKSVIGNGTFNMTDKNFALNDVAVRYGDDTSGSAAIADINLIYPSRPEDKVKVSTLFRFTHLNADMFKSYFPKMDSWKDALSLISKVLPSDTDLAVQANQITLFEQPIKDFGLSVDFHDNNVTIREAKATLPEKTSVDINGNIDLNSKDPLIQLRYSLQTENPQATFVWLNLKKLPFSTKDIRNLQLTGKMRVREKDLTFSDIGLVVNDGSVKGNMAFALTEPKLTGYVNLNLNKINLDDFFPYSAPSEDRSLIEWLQDTEKTLKTSSLLSDVNLTLNLSGNDITFKTLPIEQFTYDGRIDSKTWITNLLKISQVAMSNITYGGTIQKLSDGSLYFKDIQIDLEMPKSLLLLNRLKIQSPIAGNISKIDFKTALSGSFDKINIDSKINLAQGRIAFQGFLENLLTNSPSYSLIIQVSHPNFHQFMRLFDPSFKSLPSLSGSFSFDGTVKGTPGQLSLSETAVSVGVQKLNGNLKLVRTENGMRADGTISSPYLYLDKFISNTSLVGGVNAKNGKSEFSSNLLKLDVLNDLSLDVQLSASKLALGKLELSSFNSRILLDEKVLMINDAKAFLNGGPVDFSSVLNVTTATPYLKGSIKMDKVPVRPDLLTLGLFRLKSGAASLTSDFDAKGNSVDDMIRSLSSTGRFSIQNGIISSLNLNAFEHRIRATLARHESLNNLTQQLQKEMTLGETPFDSLEGSFAVTNGLLRTSDTILRTQDAGAIIQVNFDIPEWFINTSSAINLKSFTGYPPISVVVKGVAYNPQTNIDFSSFIGHLEAASADAKNRLLQKERAKQEEAARVESQDRVHSVSEMLTRAEQQVANAEQAIQVISTTTMKTELIRAKDALVVLRELAKKQALSPADAEKASIQATLIATRTSTIMKEVAQQAANQIRSEIAQINQQAEQKMHMVHRVWQRLRGVEQIDQAYQKAFSMTTKIQQLSFLAKQSLDLGKLQQAEKDAKEALDIIDLSYESVAKFDVDAEPSEEQEAPTQVSGSIRRGS